MYIVHFRFEGRTYYLSNPSLSSLFNCTLSRARAYKFLSRSYAVVSAGNLADSVKTFTGKKIKPVIKFI
jgi:hypothetical protein